MSRRFTYDCVITKEDDGYIASFPQIPEAYSDGDTREEAIARASEALVLAMVGHVENGTQAPAYERSAEVVTLSVEVGDEDVEESHYMTQASAADYLGVSLSRVGALIRSGQLDARYFGGRREVSADSVKAYAETPRKSGRPAKEACLV